MARSLLYIKGNVPGSENTLVRIRDSHKKIDKQVWDLEYPTWLPSEEELAQIESNRGLIVWEGENEDPNAWHIHDNDSPPGKEEED